METSNHTSQVERQSGNSPLESSNEDLKTLVNEVKATASTLGFRLVIEKGNIN
jgi:hypothetical protein